MLSSSRSEEHVPPLEEYTGTTKSTRTNAKGIPENGGKTATADSGNSTGKSTPTRSSGSGKSDAKGTPDTGEESGPADSGASTGISTKPPRKLTTEEAGDSE